MSNEFSQEVRALNVFEPYCEVCHSNENCSLHHIYSRGFEGAESAVNAIYLCQTHHKEADAHNQLGGKSKEFKQNLLKIRLKNLVRWGYEFKPVDKVFILKVNSDIMEVLKD